jgi:hypothetical protein
VDNCQSVSANFVFFELFKVVERVEKLQRRRPHAGEEDAEEGMDRKVKKTMGSREEVNVTVPRTVTRNVTRNVTTNQTSNTNLSSSVSTQNKYDPLSDHEDTDLVECQMEEDVEEEEPLVQEIKKEKPPPIILHGNFGAKRLLEFCKNSVKNQVLLKFTRSNTIVLTENVEDFKILRDALKDSKTADWHTYALKSEKTHAFVAYGLENNPDPEEIKKDLLSKGVKVINVYKMKNTSSSLYVVITDNRTSLSDIQSKVRTVEYVVVRWQRLINTKQIVQCHKCQVWGHSASNCYSSVKCLKCAQNHLTRDCTLKKDVAEDQKKLKCANCGQGHLASSQICEAYLARRTYVEQIKAAAVDRRVPAMKKYVPAPVPVKNAWTTPRKFPSSSPNPAEAHMKSVRSRLAEEVSASQDPVPVPTTTPSDSQPPSNYSDFFSLVAEIRKLNEVIDIKNLIKIIRELTSKLKNCRDSFERIEIIMEFSEKLAI